jgi:aminopeptidase N
MKKMMRLIPMIFLLITTIESQQVIREEWSCSNAKTAFTSVKLFESMRGNQQDFDVKFYDLNLQILVEDERIAGTVSIVFTALVDNLLRIDLDLRDGLTVDSTSSQNGNLLDHTHSNDLLSIILNTSLDSGEDGEVIIYYSGQPSSTGLGSFEFNHYAGFPMIWTLSEPYGARDWWPCKDTPLDKADSVDITIRVPHPLVVASNGLLDRVDTDFTGNTRWDTYVWQERYPIATYLVSMAIYPYAVYHDWYVNSEQDSMRLDFYVFPDHLQAVDMNFSQTNDMISGFAGIFGEYPFIDEKYGHAEFLWGGGMEHQTLSSMGGYSEGLIAHELAHQWWGDMVTCANFHHIWLNEGFATYGDALWREIRDGDIESLRQFMNGRKYFGPGTVYVSDTASVSAIFHKGLSYNKSAWILHMLRGIVGDSLFFSGIKTYGDHFRYSSAVTEDFRDAMEGIVGIELDNFFNQWIYGSHYPVYSLYYEQNDSAVEIIINQASDGNTTFEMPIELELVFDDTTIFHTVQHSGNLQYYTVARPAGKPVREIILDPNEWILKDVIYLETTPVTLPTEFRLFPIYPNPSNSSATIRFITDREGEISVQIYNILGEIYYRSVSYRFEGEHLVTWDGISSTGDKAPAGIYFVRVDNGVNSQVRKMVLLK